MPNDKINGFEAGIPEHICVIEIPLTSDDDDAPYQFVEIVRTSRSATPWEYREQIINADGFVGCETVARDLGDVEALMRLLLHIPDLPGGTALTIGMSEV